MRAVYLENLEAQPQYLLAGDAFHHLVHVVRIARGDEVLLLNGKGLQVRTRVTEVQKKTVTLVKLDEKVVALPYQYDLALGIPKKEALELCLKEAVELGFRRIFLVRGTYSQVKIPETDRIRSILVAALEQSNSPVLPEVLEARWDEIPWNDYGTVLLLDSQNPSGNRQEKISGAGLLVVGPEGGFSADETALLRSANMVEVLRLETPILRTPTAVATGAGILLQRLMS